MQSLATFLCVVFIAWLLVRDSKRRPPLSAATWIPTFLVFTLGSRTPGQWLGQDAKGVWIDQVYAALMIAASLIILFSRAVKWRKLFAANTAIMLFYGYFAISFIWSPHPVDSLVRLLKDFGLIVFTILVIFSEKNPSEAVRAVYVRCACVAFPLSMLFTRFTDFGRSYDQSGLLMYNGVATQKNSLGAMLMVCSLFLVWDHLESRPEGAKRLWSGMRWDRLVLLLLGAWLLHLSQSKTSLVCVVIGLALIFARGRLASRMASTVIFVFALSLPFLVLLTQQWSAVGAPLLETLGRDATFTGRAGVWKEITFTTVNPLIGNGFWNFWGEEGAKAISQAAGVEVMNAHDGYLDLYLDGGLIGLALLFLLLVASARRIIRTRLLKRFQRVRFAFLIIAIFGNLTETFFARPNPLWFTTVLVSISYPFRDKDLGGRGIA